MEKFKKVLAFIALFMSVVGISGAFGYCVYIGQPAIALCVVVASMVCCPGIMKLLDFLRD